MGKTAVFKTCRHPIAVARVGLVTQHHLPSAELISAFQNEALFHRVLVGKILIAQIHHRLRQLLPAVAGGQQPHPQQVGKRLVDEQLLVDRGLPRFVLNHLARLHDKAAFELHRLSGEGVDEPFVAGLAAGGVERNGLFLPHHSSGHVFVGQRHLHIFHQLLKVNMTRLHRQPHPAGGGNGDIEVGGAAADPFSVWPKAVVAEADAVAIVIIAGIANQAGVPRLRLNAGEGKGLVLFLMVAVFIHPFVAHIHLHQIQRRVAIVGNGTDFQPQMLEKVIVEVNGADILLKLLAR